MSHRFTGLFCAFVLLLAPLSAAFALSCECVHDGSTTAELAPIPCCESIPHPCCFESHGQVLPTSELIAELPSVPRLAQPALLERLSVMPPIDARDSEVVRAPRAERPPGSISRELSLQQSWLI